MVLAKNDVTALGAREIQDMNKVEGCPRQTHVTQQTRTTLARFCLPTVSAPLPVDSICRVTLPLSVAFTHAPLLLVAVDTSVALQPIGRRLEEIQLVYIHVHYVIVSVCVCPASSQQLSAREAAGASGTRAANSP